MINIKKSFLNYITDCLISVRTENDYPSRLTKKNIIIMATILQLASQRTVFTNHLIQRKDWQICADKYVQESLVNLCK